MTPDTAPNVTSFVDENPLAGGIYMVRAVKTETSGSGTYLNASQGIFYTNTVSVGSAEMTMTESFQTTGFRVQGVNAPLPPSSLVANALSAREVRLTWQDN